MADRALNDSGLAYLWLQLKQKFLPQVTNVFYSNGKIYRERSITDSNGAIVGEVAGREVTSAAQIVQDGGGITSHQDISGKADKSVQSIANDTAHSGSDGHDYTQGKRITISTATGAQSVDVVPHNIVKGFPSEQNDNTQYIPTWEGIMQWVLAKLSVLSNYAKKTDLNDYVTDDVFDDALSNYEVNLSQVENSGTTISVGGAAAKSIVTNSDPRDQSGTFIAPSWEAVNTQLAAKVPSGRTVNGHALSSNVTVTKGDVGLGNVTNDSQVKRTEMGAKGGVATLDSNGKVPTSQLPSYVSDVIEVYGREDATSLNADAFSATKGGPALTPASNKIYVLVEEFILHSLTDVTYPVNSQFRWGGSSYVPMFDGGVSWITQEEIDDILAS